MDEIYYRALEKKDRAFDGKVFYGVKTTGIYCRPVCPARVPLFKNVAFYRTAAEARKAGFRACLRCRPESRPGSPVWEGTSASVSRALRLISEEVVPKKELASLAQTLGMTDRHLRRLFRRHLGATPLSVVLERRLSFAKKLVEESRLPVADIAFASGFQSLRRFNDAFKKRFEKSPTTMRRQA